MYSMPQYHVCYSHLATQSLSLSLSLVLSKHTRTKYLPFSLSLSSPISSLPAAHPPHTHAHAFHSILIFISVRTASSAINNAALAATLAPKNGIAARVNTRNAAVDDIAFHSLSL